MTEEIIIDGVNVAGCEFCKPNPLYKIEYSCNCRGYIQDDGLHTHLSCEHNPNCYYKQLKRLEQENAELKKEKQEIKNYLGIESKTILERLEELDEWKHNDKLLLWKYRSALEEISGLASPHCTQCSQIIKIVNEVLQ